MKLLLDTHIWLWSLLEPERLSDEVASRLEASGSELWLSPISVWETMMLAQRSRLRLDDEPRRWVERALQTPPMREAPLTREVAIASRGVDLDHQDPADRFLVASAMVHDLVLVTGDDRLIGSTDAQVLANR